MLAFVGIQFVRPSFNNPPVREGAGIEDFYEVPEELAGILERSCADCHSNRTKYPWYSGVAPLSWGMDDHIRVGRDDLNFDEWADYSARKREKKLEEICEMVREDEMPYYQYLWLHWDAALDGRQKQLICDWTESVLEKEFGQTAPVEKES